MKEKKFLDTISDDILMIEDSYKAYLEKHPEIDLLIWPSLCRIYVMVSISMLEYFIEFIREKAEIPKEGEWRKNVENIIKKALKRSDLPAELEIPEKIDKFVCLRELRHYITHTGINKKTRERVQRLDLTLDIEKYNEKEFVIIKQVVEDTTNLLGMSLVLIENPQLDV